MTDVIMGAAGAIPALLWLYSRQRQAPLLDLAARLGWRLLATAQRQPSGWSWPASGIPAARNLTGFAHGAAGIAWALLELWRAVDEPDFRTAAVYGFAYERRWFDPQRGNWPDFRRAAGRPDAPEGTWAYGRAWCHGAAGGALARLRAYQITGDVIYRAEADAALSTTESSLTENDTQSEQNYSLCHGRAGNADVLLTAAGIRGEAHYRQAAEVVGRGGCSSVQQAHLPWPCGVPGGGETPGLMLGLAGIGHFYLRLYDPLAIPSVLLIPL